MSTPTPADVLAQRLTGANPETEEVVDPEAEIEATEPETEESEEVDSEESTDTEEELPEKVKEILNKNRKELREAKAELLELKKAKEEPKDAVEAAPAEDRYKKLFVNTAAKSALIEAGLSSGTERFLKMLDLDSVDVDDDGNITGLTDQVASLTTEFSDLIVSKEPVVKKTVKSDAAGRHETPTPTRSSAELLAERMTAKK